MLNQQARDEWLVREGAGPIYPTMAFVPEGLVLGAGTVIVPMERPRRLQRLRGQEARVLALLSAFYDRPTAPSALGNIERAAKAWSEGANCLSYVHLTHAGLTPPQDLRSGAYRLEMACCAMRCGASPRAVFRALHLNARYIEAVEKAYNPAEPRVSAGSGRTSGEWTSGGAATAKAPPQVKQAAIAPQARLCSAKRHCRQRACSAISARGRWRSLAHMLRACLAPLAR